jgi:membrane protein
MEHVWLGSIVTGILFTIGKLYWPSISALQILRLFMGCRLRHLVLLWVSYSSMILFFGAEFTAACKNLYWYSSSLRNQKEPSNSKKYS